MKQFECFDCGNFFDDKDTPELTAEEKISGVPLLCPYCNSENVEDLKREII